MRDKNAISMGHLDEMKARYGELRSRPTRQALVVGADPDHGNIGSSIADCLRDEAFDVAETGLAYGTDIGDGFALMTAGLERYDTLVLANGETSLQWIENQDRTKSVIHNSLTASILATEEFVRRTIDKPYLKYIVYVGSMAHKAVLNASASYCAAKAGLNHYARCAAWELTPKGYRVFCVNPSNTVGTPMTEATIEGVRNYRGISHEEAEAYWGALNLMPDWLHPEDIAELITLLVTDHALAYLGGSSIDLSAGQR